VRRLLAVVLAALAFPAAASAHATLTKTQPEYGTRVEQSPTVVRLDFDQTVDALPNAIKVYTADGKLLSGPTHTTTGGRVMVAAVSRLARGGYTVRWQAISADGHVVSGVFTFGVRQKAPSASDAFGAGGPTTEEHVVRWLYFVALALLAGGLGFRLLIVRRPFAPADTAELVVDLAAGRRRSDDDHHHAEEGGDHREDRADHAVAGGVRAEHMRQVHRRPNRIQRQQRRSDDGERDELAARDSPGAEHPAAPGQEDR